MKHYAQLNSIMLSKLKCAQHYSKNSYNHVFPIFLIITLNQKSSAARYAVYLTDRAFFIMAGYIMILNVIYPFSSHTAVIFPLCDSTIDFASDNPIPDPPVSEFLELSGL